MDSGVSTGTASVPCWPDSIPRLPTYISDLVIHSISESKSGYIIKAKTELRASVALREVYQEYHAAGYDIDCTATGEYVIFRIEPLGTTPQILLPSVFFLATVASTLFAGATWYSLNPYSIEILHSVPFVISVLGVLGIHEFGHYLASRYYNVRASLPFFLPIPTLIGTMGAVIRMQGRIPTRKALFDIGVSGPLFGLGATVVVAVVGLSLPPVPTPAFSTGGGEILTISLGFPPLLQFLAWVTGQPLYYSDGLMVNPVVVGAWVGLLITFLNLLPVGQLDGGHILRAMIGKKQDRVASAVPLALVALSAWMYQTFPDHRNAVLLWVVWAVLAFVFMAGGASKPVYETPLGTKRTLIGLATFALGVLSFTPIPIYLG